MKTVHCAAVAATLLLAGQTAALAHVTLEPSKARSGGDSAFAGAFASALQDGAALTGGASRSKASAPMIRVAAAANAQNGMAGNGIAQNATSYTIGKITVSTPWTRATPKGAPVGGGYLTITNTGTEPDQLIGGSFPIAGKVEVHEMSMDHGMMKMRQLPNGLEIAPGATVELKPGGFHVMFQQLKEPIVQGKPISGTLTFREGGQSLTIDWAVSPIGATSAPGAAAEHRH